MKKILLFFWAIFSFFYSFSAPIDSKQAALVAENYLKHVIQLNKFSVQVNELSLQYAEKINALEKSSANAYYVFSINPTGFIIVSADNNIQPILAYSLENNFDLKEMPSQVKDWLLTYQGQIKYIVENNINSSADQLNWKNYINNNFVHTKTTPTAVKPLLKTTWNQDPYYNDQCPYDNTAGELAVTGCVATAMAQTMKYWSWPSQGTGSHSYTHATYGTLSANFGTTTYNWANMPNDVNSANADVAQLMYQCGVAVDMDYSPTGSSAYMSYPNNTKAQTRLALVSYFGYKNSIQKISKSNYASDALWTTAIKNELLAGRVVIYEGFNSTNTSGHCFVADGFDASDYIHFNWGWGGLYNGYFSVASLVPSGTGTGGGAGDYTYTQGALIGIQPPSSSAPVANFAANATQGVVNQLFNLTDLTTNIPTSWSWAISPNTYTFQNGTSDASKNVDLIFSATGQYTITLTATNSTGSNAVTKTAYVTINPALASQTCDTLTNFGVNDIKSKYTASGGGYYCGHNVYGHKGQAEYYASYSPYNYITGVELDFWKATAVNSTNTFNVNVYGVTGGKPGSILATTTVKYSDVVNNRANGNKTAAYFTTPLQITGAFFVGIEYTYVNAGDTIALYTDKTNTATSNTAYVKTPTNGGTWSAYSSTWSSNQHIMISPIVSIMPTAAFTYTSCLKAGGITVELDATTTTNAASYSWSVPNATTTSYSPYYKASPVFNANGTYPVTLTVTGVCGLTNSITQNVTTSTTTPNITINNSANVITSGQSVTLTASGAQSYSWDNSVTNGVAFTPSATKTYTVTATDASGCINTSTTTVTVNSPSASISGTTTLCAGSTSSLNGTGTPHASTPWASSSTSVATINTNGLVTALSFGTTTITYKDNNGNTATTIVTVNSLPTINGSLYACKNATNVLITGSGTPANSNAWSSSDQTVATISASGYLSALKVGNSMLTYTDVNGCAYSAVYTVYDLPTISGGTSVCVNSNLQLSGSGTAANSNAWSSSTSSNATISNLGLVAGVQQGNTTITYTDNHGCQNTQNISILAAPSITGNSNLCESSNLTLTGSGTAANLNPWISSNTSVATINGGTVSSLTAGSTTITYTNTAGCSTTKVITVNAKPVISGNNSVCLNGTLQLSGNLTAASSNAWISSNTTVATINSQGLITAKAVGASTITFTTNVGCQNTFTVAVNGLPSVNVQSTATTICVGSNVTLTATGTGTQYNWNNGVQNGIAFSPQSTQTYTVTAVDANNCSTTSTITITVDGVGGNQKPLVSYTISADTIAPSIGINCTNATTGTGTITYQWVFTGAQTTSSTLTAPQNIVYNSVGVYPIKLIASNCYGTDSLTKQLVVSNSNAGITALESNPPTIFVDYPTNMIYVNMNSSSAQGEIKLINSLGQVLQQQKVNQTNTSDPIEINAANLSKGVYFIDITNGKQHYSRKIQL